MMTNVFHVVHKFKNMTEKELMNLDFEKVWVMDEESDNGYDYYYFRKQIGGSMFLAADDFNKTQELSVYIEEPRLVIKDINLVKELINVFRKICKEKR